MQPKTIQKKPKNFVRSPLKLVYSKQFIAKRNRELKELFARTQAGVEILNPAQKTTNQS